ncbi:hypothetical protein Kpol_1018p21 [Vanderwaltozyma polyspora DSM 70294]|uniref:Spindle pole component BBP1 n=1 Tax=Vanderwaltozyma polyspora (strain ATCC 22028 / DSM 70294 / BCRC 21397 / CBS 2163 / NBRC 10782 / NRRL Y-8283 / UCD 57-17) TaxID=436907 RepID=BBP1_VANPO|nr:uncharacterized protein Kpol_1018p21 [Vanderwaltozyma polyspora DSM 70294]A7TDM3.1 RecName: Full=Spindle pole component BBP1 [Vanderwaltozyma polyspora DSM 70294]EDO19493.1 hypothetical protein Kpol_1018p21 [Vanderwaltozyma polyspora DSM 70294]
MGSQKNYLSDDSTGGGFGVLFKWTKDALFGSRITPSRKYKEFAQDDTNYKIKRSVGKSAVGRRSRSNSWSGLDSSFYQKYDLLEDEDEDDDEKVFGMPSHLVGSGGSRSCNGDDIVGKAVPFGLDSQRRKRLQSLLDPVDLHPMREDVDTFANNLKFHNTSKLDSFDDLMQTPRQDKEFISKLFGKDTGNEPEPMSYRQFPGKFPSPGKNPTSSTKIKQVDHTDEYLQLLDKLDKNSKMIDSLNREVQNKKQQTKLQESNYKNKYMQTRNELINELRHSKKLYDNYYKLFQKYQQLKIISKESLELQNRIPTLDDRLVNETLVKDRKINELQKRIQSLQIANENLTTQREIDILKYESRIKELEAKLILQNDVHSQFHHSTSTYNNNNEFLNTDYDIDTLDTSFSRHLNINNTNYKP